MSYTKISIVITHFINETAILRWQIASAASLFPVKLWNGSIPGDVNMVLFESEVCTAYGMTHFRTGPNDIQFISMLGGTAARSLAQNPKKFWKQNEIYWETWSWHWKTNHPQWLGLHIKLFK